MNVLSLFDGMSCGQIALERTGIKVDNYFASEIKPQAIKVTQHNYPKTIQLGDVTKIKGCNLPKIDLLIGGSPCQDFSRANMERKGLKGGKSSLFMEYLRVVEEVKPSFFLLENVVMDFMDEMTITNYMKTRPVKINSSLVSAQMRERLYWTNIGPEDFDLFGNRESSIPQPTDKCISFQSVLSSGYADKIKSHCLHTSNGQTGKDPVKMWARYNTCRMDNLVFIDPSLDHQKGIRYLEQSELERLQTLPDGYTHILDIKKAHNLIGDGWTVDVIAHIFRFLPGIYKNHDKTEV